MNTICCVARCSVHNSRIQPKWKIEISKAMTIRTKNLPKRQKQGIFGHTNDRCSLWTPIRDAAMPRQRFSSICLAPLYAFAAVPRQYHLWIWFGCFARFSEMWKTMCCWHKPRFCQWRWSYAQSLWNSNAILSTLRLSFPWASEVLRWCWMGIFLQ